MKGSENPMPEPRPAASLTGSLLARRGGARPAMRRQPILNGLSGNNHHDDLGWNDMGEEGEGRTVVEPISAAVPPPDVSQPSSSPIAEQISVLTQQLKTSARAKAKANAPAKARPATLVATGHKAAFTLRIDAERHLRLRLLSALSNRSAQRLLIEALDAMLAQNDELRALAEQIESRSSAVSDKTKSQR